MTASNHHDPHVEKGVLEQKVDHISSTLHGFIDAQLFTSSLLFVCIFIAVLMSNLDVVHCGYHALINTPFGLHFNGYVINTTLHDFVNDFLLTIFFFVLGLEVKREFVIGELSELSKSMYVVLCALGGALLPIVAYVLINHGHPETLNGWAIPMATDTALAIGVLYLFKHKISKKAFTLVASLAVIDDILIIIVIAVFYSSHFNLMMFLVALLVLLGLVMMNVCGFRHPIIYIILGFFLWLCIESAGIHGTIAGILVAMCIPARPKKKPKSAVKKIRKLLNKFEAEYNHEKHLLEDERPHELLENVTDASLEATTPLKRWENQLEIPVLVLILPLFALTNGGFDIDFAHMSQTLSSSLFWGIFISLVIAKPVGLLLTSWSVQKLGVASRPQCIEVYDIIVIAFLAGIGYTMSIFTSELSFTSGALSDMAKLSIFVSSSISALIAMSLMRIKPDD
ncbi:MAG: Na+/H+ antiporter NhaA [Legionellaceae bacterium]|nr:Na+/H+ antiporter NhaA [Legionellaceae bacterium]